MHGDMHVEAKQALCNTLKPPTAQQRWSHTHCSQALNCGTPPMGIVMRVVFAVTGAVHTVTRKPRTKYLAIDLSSNAYTDMRHFKCKVCQP